MVRALTNLGTPNSRFGETPQLEYAPTYYYPNALSQDAASPVEVGAGVEVRGIDIHLVKVARPRYFRVTGKVIGAQPGIEISMSFSGRASPPDYVFDLVNVPAGQHTIIAHVYSGGPEAYAIENLTVTGNMTGVILTMRPPPEVAAQIKLAENDKQVNLKGVRVALNRRPTFFQDPFAESDAMGKLVFTQPIPPGQYSVNINRNSLPDGCFVQKMLLGRQEIAGDEVELQTSTSLEIIFSATAGTITGSASDADGKLFSNPTVALFPPDTRSRPEKQVVDDDGNFKFTNLRPGKYKLLAWEEVDDGLWQDPDFRKKYENRATEIAVGPSETRNAQVRVIATEEMK